MEWTWCVQNVPRPIKATSIAFNNILWQAELQILDDVLEKHGLFFIPVVRLADVSNQPNVRPYPGW
jgi:hypothetical protein